MIHEIAAKTCHPLTPVIRKRRKGKARGSISWSPKSIIDELINQNEEQKVKKKNHDYWTFDQLVERSKFSDLENTISNDDLLEIELTY
jgi:hypothetical protein